MELLEVHMEHAKEALWESEKLKSLEVEVDTLETPGRDEAISQAERQKISIQNARIVSNQVGLAIQNEIDRTMESQELLNHKGELLKRLVEVWQFENSTLEERQQNKKIRHIDKGTQGVVNTFTEKGTSYCIKSTQGATESLQNMKWRLGDLDMKKEQKIQSIAYEMDIAVPQPALYASINVDDDELNSFEAIVMKEIKNTEDGIEGSTALSGLKFPKEGIDTVEFEKAINQLEEDLMKMNQGNPEKGLPGILHRDLGGKGGERNVLIQENKTIENGEIHKSYKIYIIDFGYAIELDESSKKSQDDDTVIISTLRRKFLKEVS